MVTMTSKGRQHWMARRIGEARRIRLTAPHFGEPESRYVFARMQHHVHDDHPCVRYQALDDGRREAM